MNILRLLVATIILLAAPLHAAETLKLDGHTASAISVLAKIKSGKGTKSQITQALANSPHVSGVRGFVNIPSVVVIDLKSPAKKAAAPTAASDKVAAGELARRIAELQATGLFEYVEPDYIVRPNNLPNDAAFGDGRLWGLRNQGQNGGVAGADIDAPGAWQTTTGSSDVIVAVIDTGIRYTHTDLAANMWVNPGEIPGNGVDDDANGFVDDIHGINAVNGSGDPMDTDGHGSHCAGTIGAVANGGGPHVGVAWNVRLMALKFLDPFGATSDAITCIDYAISKGADIMSNSWGGGGFSQALADAIERANAGGILFVAAAGNSGTNNDQQPHYPSNYENANVVAVAALDRNDGLANFSCFGATSVDLGAPGVSIFSCTAASDTSYDFYDGTSMATPHVSGVAALIKSHFPGAGAAELKQRLLQGARPIGALLGKSVTGGALDAAQSLSISEDGILELNVSTTPAPLRAGATVVMRVGVSDLNGVTGAAVTGTFAAQGPLTFVDNGTFPDTTANDAIYSAQFNVPQTAADSLALTLNVSAAGKQPVNGATFDLQIVRPPANDNFANRIALQSGTTAVSGSNVESSSEVGEPINPGVAGGKTVWWSYTPGFSGEVTVTTAGSDYDTTLAVYQGGALDALSLLGSNDDAIGYQSSVTFTVTAGTQYLLQVDGYAGSTGQIVLNYPDPSSIGAPPAITEQPADQRVLVGQTIDLSVVALNADSYQWYFEGSAIPGATGADLSIPSATFANTGGYRCDVSNEFGTTPSREAFVIVESTQTTPQNDSFVDSDQLSGDAGRTFGSNVASTGEFGEPNHAGVSDLGNGLRSVWWTWTAPFDGNLEVDTGGSDYDTTLAVYAGSSVDALTELASNDDDPNGGLSSRVSLAVTAGQQYRIAVAGYNSRNGAVVLNHLFTPGGAQAPANDNFGDRIVLAEDWASVSGTNAFASGEPGEPDHALASTPIQSVWWEWTPSQSGTVSIDTFGSNFDTTLAVYTGSSLGDLVQIRANDQYNGNQSLVQFPAVAGTTYFIAVDGWISNTGDIQLNRSASQPPLDRGSNYGGNWGDQSNGGTGFNSWSVVSDGSGGSAGAFIGDPAGSGIGGMSPESFCLDAAGLGSYVNADRALQAPLEIGQSLSIQWGINWDGNNGDTGNKGFNLYAAGLEVINVNNAGTSAITLNGIDIGFGYGTNAMTWTFERVSATELRVTANDRDGQGEFSTIVIVPDSAIGSFRLYAAGMGSETNRRSYYDNLIVSAAPATLAVYPAQVDGLSAIAGSPSASQGVILSAENITQDVIVTAPWGFAVSSDDVNFANTASFANVGGIVSATVYVRIAENASVGPAAGQLTVSTYGAPNVFVPLSGSVDSGYYVGYNAGYTQGYSDGAMIGRSGGYADAIADLTNDADLAASYGLHTTDAIMEMNLGGVMTHINAGNVVLRLQLETAPDLTQPFVDYGEPVEMLIPMQGQKRFMRIRALGEQ